MPSITQQLDAAFRAAITAAFGFDADPVITASANAQFGDYQSNAAMGLAKRVAEQTGAKANPRQIAEQIKAKLALGDLATEVSIAGPGFINVRLNPAFLASELNRELGDPRLGVPLAASPETVVIDYSAPNVAKEMHVGHLRTTVIGDTFARVLTFLGHNIIRQNHIGDWGTQFGRVMLGLWYDAVASVDGRADQLDKWMAHAMAIAKAAEGETPEQKQARSRAQNDLLQQLVPWHQAAIDADPTGELVFRPFLEKSFPSLARLQSLYQFASAITEFDAAKSAAIRRGSEIHTLDALPSLFAMYVQQPNKPKNEQEAIAWTKSIESTMAACQAIYDQLGVLLKPSDVRGESFYNPMLPGVVEDLTNAGIAQTSDGASVVFVEGFEAPLIIQKRNGGYGYATSDLAAVRYRVGELGAKRAIYVVGLPQSQHLAQVFSVAKRAGWADGVTLEHAGFGNVLGDDGKLLRTRAGGTVKLADVLDEAEARALALVTRKNDEAEGDRKLPSANLPSIAHAVGIGAVKYFDLLRDRLGDYKFSYDAMLSLDGNTAPYLQYAHARIRSIFRRAELGRSASASLRITAISEPAEITLAKQLLRFGETVEGVARELKPHFLCTYLYELAGAFSSFYDACPVLKSDEPMRTSRLALCEITARTLALGLDLLGIGHPEQM
jgi:arginyl-tRNA synthetase